MAQSKHIRKVTLPQGRPKPQPEDHAHSLRKGANLLPASVAAFLLFAIMAFLVRGLAPLSMDLSITQMVQSMALAPHVFGYPIPIYSQLMTLISQIGFWPYNLIIGLVTVAVLLYFRRAVEALTLTISITIVEFIVSLVKDWFARPRPSPPYLNVPTPIDGYSFPSGHVAGYVCFFGFIFYLAWTHLLMKPGWARTLTLILTGALVALVGVSRIYLGHHWASDVLGGYGLGFGWLCLCIWAYRRWQTKSVINKSKITA